MPFTNDLILSFVDLLAEIAKEPDNYRDKDVFVKRNEKPDTTRRPKSYMSIALKKLAISFIPIKRGSCRQTALLCNISGTNQRSFHEIVKEDLSMVLDSKSGQTVMRLWLLLHRVNDIISLCEDSIFQEYGLTVEQWRVLACLQYRGGSLRPIDLAMALDRSPNSVSMLIDRMVKAGLVRRTRDRHDRRTVNVTLTNKGENAVGPATPAGWEVIQKILSPLSYEDRQALAGLLETVKCEAFGCLHPELDMSEIVKNSYTKDPHLYKGMVKYLYPPAPKSNVEVERQNRPC